MNTDNDFEICDECVVQPWLNDLSYKQQTVLLSAIRGCDSVPKGDISKKLLRAYRSEILRNAAKENDGHLDRHFMKDRILATDLEEFVGSLDHYPMHWLLHFIHAIEILGYKHPFSHKRQWWRDLYKAMVDALHLNVETEEENDIRLRDGIPRDCWK